MRFKTELLFLLIIVGATLNFPSTALGSPYMEITDMPIPYAMMNPMNDMFDRQIEILNNKLEETSAKIDALEKEIAEKESLLAIQEISFNPDDMTIKSGMTKEVADYILRDTGFEGCSEAFISAEEEYGVNCIGLMLIMGHESAWGTSNMARTKNNISGYKAYNSSPSSASQFNSFDECIQRTAKLIGRSYLPEDGKFFHGKGIKDVNVKYAQMNDGSPNWEWSGDIINMNKTMQEKIDEFVKKKLEDSL